VVAYVLSGSIDVAVLLPFAAGNYIYIALADLIPELTSQVAPRTKMVQTGCFVGGLGSLYLVALATA
jgi:zinc and cadmium transporter